MLALFAVLALGVMQTLAFAGVRMTAERVLIACARYTLCERVTSGRLTSKARCAVLALSIHIADGTLALLDILGKFSIALFVVVVCRRFLTRLVENNHQVIIVVVDVVVVIDSTLQLKIRQNSVC